MLLNLKEYFKTNSIIYSRNDPHQFPVDQTQSPSTPAFIPFATRVLVVLLLLHHPPSPPSLLLPPGAAASGSRFLLPAVGGGIGPKDTGWEVGVKSDYTSFLLLIFLLYTPPLNERDCPRKGSVSITGIPGFGAPT